jgi:two-component sensor histidine kinase
MNDSELMVQRPSLRSLTEAISFFTLNAAGLVIFVPSGFFLASSGSGEVPDWLSWFIPLGLWASGYLPGFRQARAAVQVSAGLLLALMTFVVPEGPAWIPVGIVTFAVIVAAVFNLSTKAAALVIVVAAGLDLLAMQSNAASIGLFGVGLITPWAGALLNLIAGGGVLLAWTAWMGKVRQADREFEEIQSARAIEAQVSAAETGAEAVRRRIHETILNTLAGISMGLPNEAQQRAELTCQRDLEQLRRGLDRLDDSSISHIITAAQQALQPTPLQCSVRISRDVTVTAGVANALRDAITESLRNVERHSGTLNATITSDVSDEVIITITDDGVGPSPSAQERFGTRNAVRANLRAIGGSATLSRGAHGGTEVTLHAPLTEPVIEQVPTFPVVGVADSTLWGRLGVTGTNIYLLILTPFILTEFPRRELTAAAIIAYVGCMLALALLWTTRAKPPLVLVSFVLLPLPFLAAGSETLTCVAAPGSQGLIAGMAGGGVMLLLIAARNIGLRLTIAGVAFAASLWLAFQLPDACQDEALLSASVTAIYMAAITIVLTWIDLRFETRRARAQLDWERLLDERINRERRAAEAVSWLAVSTTTRDLLEEIARGQLAVSDPRIQTRAAEEAELLRSQLGLSPRNSTILDQLTRDLAPAAKQAGATIEVETLIAGRREDPLPDAIIQFIDQLIRANAPSTINLRAILDEEWEEFVLVMQADLASDTPPENVADAIVEIGQEGNSLHISVRRPVTPR